MRTRCPPTLPCPWGRGQPPEPPQDLPASARRLGFPGAAAPCRVGSGLRGKATLQTLAPAVTKVREGDPGPVQRWF